MIVGRDSHEGRKAIEDVVHFTAQSELGDAFKECHRDQGGYLGRRRICGSLSDDCLLYTSDAADE